MIKFMKNTGISARAIKQKVTYCLLAASLIISMMPVNAGTIEQTGIGNDIKADEVIERFITQILDIFKYVGVIMAIWGAVQLIQAFRNEDADSKSRAIMVLVSAIFLMGIKSVLQGVGILS